MINDTIFDLFVSNANAVKKTFIWHNTINKRLTALLYTAENKAVDVEAIKKSYELLKQKTGIFSYFRGNSALNLATLLSLSNNKEERLSDTINVYKMMKYVGFKSSSYLVIAAFLIASNSGPEDFETRVKRAYEFYNGMKKKHPLLTGQDDYIFSAMLGLSDVDISIGIDKMESIYSGLKGEFISKNGLQALTQVLVLGGDNSIERVLTLREALRMRSIKMEGRYTLSTLGVLSLLPADTEKIADEVEQTFRRLRLTRGFGAWSITKDEALLLSSALVSYNYLDGAKKGILDAAISTSITNIIIAQQTAIAAATAASSAAASASSASN